MDNEEKTVVEDTATEEVVIDNDNEDVGNQELTAEIVSEWVSSELGKKWGISYADKRVTEGIKTFKEKTLPTLLQERENKIREELMPKETPQDKALANIMKERIEEKAQAKQVELENFAIKRANTLGLNNIGEQIGYFIAPDEDEIQKRLEWIVQRDKESFENGRNSFLKENAHVPESGDEGEDVMFKTVKAYGDYLKRNPSKAYDSKIYEKIASYEKRVKR